MGEGPIQLRGACGRERAEAGGEPREQVQEEPGEGTDSGPGRRGPWCSSPAAHSDPLPHMPVRASGLSPPRGQGVGSREDRRQHPALGAAPSLHGLGLAGPIRRTEESLSGCFGKRKAVLPLP